METTAKRLKKYSGIALGIVLVTAFVLVQPTLQTSYAQVSDLGAPAFEECTFVVDPAGAKNHGQPADPLSMNTVRVKDVAKTVIAEKEIFKCDVVQGGQDVIVDVTIYAEIYENMTSKSIIAKQARVVTCVKLDVTGADGGGILVGCDTYKPLTDFIPVSFCFELTGFAGYLLLPQEMNTVNKGNTVKTIEVQKEVFYCTFNTGPPFPTVVTGNPSFEADVDDKKVEQYIITETWENLGLLPNDPVLFSTIESLRCWTLVDSALVESCQFSTVDLEETNPFEE